MGYTRIIYKDELQGFINHFKELVMNNRIEQVQNTREMLLFLALFEQHLEESINITHIFDIRPAKDGGEFKPLDLKAKS